MAKISGVPPIPGVEDLGTLIEFLRDPKRYAAQVKTLTDMGDALDKKIALVGKADAIDGLLVQAQGDRNMAAEELANAQRDAKKMQDDAKAHIDLVQTEVADVRADLEQARKALDAERRTWEAEQQIREQAADDAQRTAATRIAQAEALQARAQAVREEFEGKLSRLNAGLAAVSG